MMPHETDLGAWRTLLEARTDTSAPLGQPRLTEAERAHRLCEEGMWLRGCAEAAQHGDPLLDASPQAEPPEGGAVAGALLLLRDRGSSSRCHPVARAIWHAARAARALPHPTAAVADFAEADVDTARAAVWCDAAQRAEHDEDAAPHHLARVRDTTFRSDHPGLPWHLADALVARCAQGPQPVYESVATKVLTGVGGAGDQVATLILDLVPDSGERVIPDPDTMLYTLGLDSLTPSLTAAFSWARGQDHFPRGHGLRWRLDGPHGPLPFIQDGTEVAAAAAVALARAIHHRRAGVFTPTGEHPKDADRRVIVHAGLEPPNRLLATRTPLDTLQRAVAAGHVLLLAPAEAARIRASAEPTPPRQLKEAADIPQAVRRSRQVPRRLVAAVCVLIAATTGLGVGLGVTAQHSADRTKVSTQAARLATSATDQQTRTPDQALADALTAHALAPGTAATHRALISASDSEANRERVIRTGMRGLRTPVLSNDGRYAAAIDSKGHPRLWRTADATPLPVPPDLTGVADLAFPGGKGPLSLATSRGLAQWDPSSAAPPRWRTRTPSILVAYSRDGAHLASADSHGTVEVRNTQPGGDVHSTRTTQGAAASLAFSADGRVLAIGLSKTLSLWAWKTAPSPEHTATGITTAVSSLTYADPCRCFYAVAGGRLHALSSTTARALRKPISVALGMSAVYSPHQELLYLAASNAVLGLDPNVNSIADKDGNLGHRRDVLATANNARSQLAANASGNRLITPSSSGGLIIYRLTDDVSHQYLPGVQRVFSLPASHSLLMVAGAYGNAFAGVFDPRTGKGTNRFAQMGAIASQQATDFDPRRSLLAVAGKDGHVRLRHVDAATQSFGPEVTLTGPSGWYAKTVAFDPPRPTLYAGWAHEIRVYDTTHPTSPRYKYKIGLPTSELILAVSPSTAHGTLFVATSRALYALPSLSGRFVWAKRMLLASGAFIQAHARPDGSVIAGTFTGALSLYRPKDGAWSALPLDHLVGSLVPFTIASYGNDIIVTSAEHATVFDAETGALTVSVTLPGKLPTAQSREGSLIRLYDDTSTVTLTLDDQALVARACALLGMSAPATVADAWPTAPASVRSRPLCRAPDRSN
ncbi:WD40 repeat domain-containing protein [Streptomyces sp. NPDC001414]